MSKDDADDDALRAHGRAFAFGPRIEDNIDYWEPSARLRDALELAGVTSLPALAAMSDREILRFDNLGRSSLDELRDILHQAGYTDRPADDPTLARVKTRDLIQELQRRGWAFRGPDDGDDKSP